jgi:hypothetical protein
MPRFLTSPTYMVPMAGAEVDRGSQWRSAMSERRAFGRQEQQRETLEGNQLETPNQAVKGSRTGRKERKEREGKGREGKARTRGP